MGYVCVDVSVRVFLSPGVCGFCVGVQMSCVLCVGVSVSEYVCACLYACFACEPLCACVSVCG